MDFLGMRLTQKGFQQEAEQLTHLPTSNTFLQDLSNILNHCVSQITLPDHIYILYTQVSHVTIFQDVYKKMIIEDLETILMETVEPSSEETSLYLEEEEVTEAIHLYGEAVIGNVAAQVELGQFYRSIRQHNWAFPWFETAATNGNPEALYWVGNYYVDGTVVEENLAKAFTCYKEAAEMGYPDAMNNLADMYLRGEYVEKDAARAYHLFMQAAEKGVPESMYTLGYMYENGVGTEVDIDASKTWYTQSAIHGDVFALNRLGHEAVEKGNGEEAISWYKQAADKGDSYGEFNLGLCYENGIGTPVNLKKAKYWYQKAALKGDQEAKRRLQEF